MPAGALRGAFIQVPLVGSCIRSNLRKPLGKRSGTSADLLRYLGVHHGHRPQRLRSGRVPVEFSRALTKVAHALTVASFPRAARLHRREQREWRLRVALALAVWVAGRPF
jgi:hypothetical protein